jgi:putative addiction module killer protein
MDVTHYVTIGGHDPTQSWLDRLKDSVGRVAVLRRIDRLATGNFGDHKYCRDGIWELRIDVGPGYRVYYAQVGKTLILLLCAGSKRTQTADIDVAVNYLADCQRRQK